MKNVLRHGREKTVGSKDMYQPLWRIIERRPHNH